MFVPRKLIECVVVESGRRRREPSRVSTRRLVANRCDNDVVEMMTSSESCRCFKHIYYQDVYVCVCIIITISDLYGRLVYAFHMYVFMCKCACILNCTIWFACCRADY